MIHQNKRRMIGAIIVILLFSACDVQVPQSSEQNTAVIRQTRELLEEITEQELRRAPELASRIGISVNSAGFDYAAVVDDRSQAAFERARLERIETLERLHRLPQGRLTEQLLKDKEIVVETLQDAVDMASFGHGQISFSYARPFVADHLSGGYIDLQDVLLFRQFFSESEGAKAYLSRLSAMADVLDDDRRRLMADANSGVVPPDFILARMAAQAETLAAPLDEVQHPLIETFQRRLGAVSDLDPEEKSALVSEASEIFETSVRPAYQRFIQTVTELQASAPSEPGIWQAPNGSEYYAEALKLYTGKAMNADELHREGLSIVASIEEALDAKLAEIELIEGPIGDRLYELSQQEGQLYTNDEDGRFALLTRLNELYQTANTRLDDIVAEGQRSSLLIAPVPDALLTSTPAAYYVAAPANGSTPASFHVNLSDTANWPDFTLPALVFHETVPGHHLESSYPEGAGRLSLIRQMIWPVAYGEGWALYAEDVAFELGLYTDQPFAEIGYLQSLLFRAARLVTDTGIHHQRWSRREAVDYLVTTTGLPESVMEAEVDRYTVWPGQAAAYMIGRNEIVRLRTRAEEVLGSNFDLPRFHHAILSGGPRPFEFVEADIDAWVAEELSR
ncbi:MAG: DUF885 family protein [Pseudomonadota bacterium]